MIDHARILYKTSCCSGRAGREAGELRRWASLCVSILFSWASAGVEPAKAEWRDVTL